MKINKPACIITAAIAAAATLSAGARTVKDFNTFPAAGFKIPITLTIDSIDYREDLARVYGHIYGRPHTSVRIDGFIINPGQTVAPAGNCLEATDVDGFEFTHRFQFEDDGDIPVEIDFPPLQPADTYFIRITNPDGQHGMTIRKAHKR